MSLFLLGRDRAFRTYYYMNCAFVIHCPRAAELGSCWGETTPAATSANGKMEGEEDMGGREAEEKREITEERNGDRTERKGDEALLIDK